MKIVDRKTFMQMPKGTVFCKFPRFDEGDHSSSKLAFAVQEPMILDGTTESDFYYIEPGFMTPVDGKSCTEDDNILMDMEANLGKEYPFEAFSSRDGMYEGDEVGFAIYSRSEVEEMICLLQKALKEGY